LYNLFAGKKVRKAYNVATTTVCKYIYNHKITLSSTTGKDEVCVVNGTTKTNELLTYGSTISQGKNYQEFLKKANTDFKADFKTHLESNGFTKRGSDWFIENAKLVTEGRTDTGACELFDIDNIKDLSGTHLPDKNLFIIGGPFIFEYQMPMRVENLPADFDCSKLKLSEE
jgi:hypothetical protein